MRTPFKLLDTKNSAKYTRYNRQARNTHSMTMLPIIAIIAGLAGLVWSADRFVAGAAATANNFGMQPIVIGLTIVALGTSAPEIMVSVQAALSNVGDIAIGNAIGSNLANIGMVLGITALIAPIPIARVVLKRELPILLVVTLCTILLLLDYQISRWNGLILLAALLAVMTLFVRNRATEPEIEAESLEHIPSMSTKVACTWLLVGLVLLSVSAELLVWGASELALSMGISQLVIGLTVVAVGTSLPELAASLISSLRGHHDIALGNILGSNLFNLLGVIGITATIKPLPIEPEALGRDYTSMTILTLILAVMLYLSSMKEEKNGSCGKLGRSGGALLLLAYATYYYVLFPFQ
jgi:cation:H+ antiporter